MVIVRKGKRFGRNLSSVAMAWKVVGEVGNLCEFFRVRVVERDGRQTCGTCVVGSRSLGGRLSRVGLVHP